MTDSDRELLQRREDYLTGLVADGLTFRYQSDIDYDALALRAVQQYAGLVREDASRVSAHVHTSYCDVRCPLDREERP